MKTGTLVLWLTAISLLAASAIGFPGPATAATATDLKCKGCVRSKDLGKKSVKSKHIKDGSVAPADLADGAKPTGVDFEEGPTSHSLSAGGAYASVVETTVTAPGPGYIVAMATWYFTAADASKMGQCYLATEAGATGGPTTVSVSSSNDAGYSTDAAALNRTIQVSAGDTTVHLNCASPTGNVSVFYPAIIAFFVPNRY